MWKIPVITAQYMMYDMPDDEILGFWGKRPFIGKGIARPKEHQDSEPLKLPALPSRVGILPQTPHPHTEPLPSWHEDLTLYHRSNLRPATDTVGDVSVEQ